MNLALFASGDVGYQVARFLRESGESLACLVINEGDPAGQAAKIAEVSGAAPERIIRSRVLYEAETLACLRELRLDLAILAWWPYILKPPLVRMPRLGCLNFHPSMLPHDRGKHYNFWTLAEGSPFGVTIHFIDEGIDTGDIAFQSSIEKTWEDTGKTLFEKAQTELVRLFIEKFPEIKAGRIPRMSQDPSEGSYHREFEMDLACRIELDRSYEARALLNLLRARTFPPHPACYFYSDGDRYEVRVEIRRVAVEP